MTANTNYKVAFEMTQLLCGFSNDIDRWHEVIDLLKTELSARAVQLTFVCTRNKKTVLDIESGNTEIPLLNWVSLNEAAIKEAVTLSETNGDYKSINLSFALTDREWGSSYPVVRQAHGPKDIEHAFVAASVCPEENFTALLGVLRDETQGEFTENELALLELVRKGLHQAFYSYARDYQNYMKLGSMHGMINRASLGLFVVDPSGHFLVSNQKARNIIDEDTLFGICRNGYLKVHDRDIHNQLKDCIGHISGKTDRSNNGGGSHETYIRVNSETDSKGYLLIVSPVDNSNEASGVYAEDISKLALIQVIDLTETWAVDSHTLRNVLDITVTEATVLKYLSEGASLREIAKMQRRSYHTIRNHVQKVMNKTGMHRQADLMLLVHSIALAGIARGEYELQRESS
ncbi:MAG: helix-turn-helix transcriptional regulator [Methyloligellaceae bacterium]